MSQVTLKDFVAAKESLQRTLALNPDISAAKHMLRALSDDESESLKQTDLTYVKDLYNSYAPTYDEHGKKLRYSTPRVIREEMATVYKAINRFEGLSLGEHTDVEGHSCAPAGIGTSEGGCAEHSHVMSPGPLDVLDLGCGTGLAGGWLKDFSKNLIGI
jgi:predicted TPR repeat methyltransferase